MLHLAHGIWHLFFLDSILTNCSLAMDHFTLVNITMRASDVHAMTKQSCFSHVVPKKICCCCCCWLLWLLWLLLLLLLLLFFPWYDHSLKHGNSMVIDFRVPQIDFGVPHPRSVFSRFFLPRSRRGFTCGMGNEETSV